LFLAAPWVSSWHLALDTFRVSEQPMTSASLSALSRGRVGDPRGLQKNKNKNKGQKENPGKKQPTGFPFVLICLFFVFVLPVEP
jgi:hypothetical protein